MNNSTARRIVVLGGSFNPPTIAHFRLLQAAIDGLRADLGVFVPSSHSYVQRKMKRTPCPDEVLPAEVRTGMLRAMCADDPRMTVSCAELDNPRCAGHTYETMQLIQQEHPGAELYFIFGADKLRVLPRWRTYEEFVTDFRVLVFSRDDVDTEAAFQASKPLAAHRESFVFLPQPEGTEEVSSTAVRELLRRKESADHLLHPGAARVLQEHLTAGPPAVIDSFRDQYRFLSNFFAASIEWEGLTYRNAEAAFQAAKVLTAEERMPFTSLNPVVAKRMGRKVPLRADWEAVKTGVMEEIVRAKFTQNPELAAKLLATGDAALIEGNAWGDRCWGVDLRTGEGENRLGRILMKVRSELKDAQS